MGIGGGAGGGESRNRAGRRVLRFGRPDGRNSSTGVGSLAYIFISYNIIYIVIYYLLAKSAQHLEMVLQVQCLHLWDLPRLPD